MAKRGEGDITDILEEIRHEKQMKEMLDQSIQHLTQEVTDMEKKAEAPVTADDMEWKTRHDIQADVNKMLSGRMAELQEKESQKYHKADEERKKVQMAIEQLKRDMAMMKRQNTLVVTLGALGADLNRPMDGLPRNKRILNPRLGPVRSSAVVNRLPRLPAKPQPKAKKGKSVMKNPDGKKGKRRERKYDG
uniref:Uncharacterized protein n=1 Tax=Branchiostoma floridae TaxID=7739 RepID=C3XR21_BRAFL|eukprot:XP_002613130.1 hypothetical protein BRAFLDRAFT_73033 [Branchiostoma floridae]